jgi:hypothetical protein
MAEELYIAKIAQEDKGTQFRVNISQAKVDEYAELLKDGADFPPITVISDGSDYWLVDGWHRLLAYQQRGAMTIPADVQPGTRRDAVIAALGVNASHGLARSNDDKRKAVLFALRDPELRLMSQHKIAKLCGVTQAMVSKLKASLDLRGDEQQYDGLLNDSRTVMMLLGEDPDHLETFLSTMILNENVYDKAARTRFEKLGLLSTYDASRHEWTPMAHEVMSHLVEGDEWRKLEYELVQMRGDNPRPYNTGKVREALMSLLNKGWVQLDGLNYQVIAWVKLLAIAGYAHQVELSATSPGNVWSVKPEPRTVQYSFVHISQLGAQLLGETMSQDIPPAPTSEQITELLHAQFHERREEQKRQQEEDKARRAQQEAERAQQLASIVGDDEYEEHLRSIFKSLLDIRNVLDALGDKPIVEGIRYDVNRAFSVIDYALSQYEEEEGEGEEVEDDEMEDEAA